MSKRFLANQPPLVEADTAEAAETKPSLPPPSSPPSRADVQRAHMRVDARFGDVSGGSDLGEFPEEIILRRPTEVTNPAE